MDRTHLERTAIPDQTEYERAEQAYDAGTLDVLSYAHSLKANVRGLIEWLDVEIAIDEAEAMQGAQN